MNPKNEPFWAPIAVRNPSRAHRWKSVQGGFLSLCGLFYKDWNIGKPDDVLQKCKLCIIQMEYENKVP